MLNFLNKNIIKNKNDADYLKDNLFVISQVVAILKSYQEKFNSIEKEINKKDPLYFFIKSELSFLNYYFLYYFPKEHSFINKIIIEIYQDEKFQNEFWNSKFPDIKNSQNENMILLFNYYFFIRDEIPDLIKPLKIYHFENKKINQIFENFISKYINEKIELLAAYFYMQHKNNEKFKFYKKILKKQFKKTKDYFYAQRKFLFLHEKIFNEIELQKIHYFEFNKDNISYKLKELIDEDHNIYYLNPKRTMPHNET